MADTKLSLLDEITSLTVLDSLPVTDQSDANKTVKATTANIILGGMASAGVKKYLGTDVSGNPGLIDQTLVTPVWRHMVFGGGG
jgi:hypothetical protein